MAKIKSSEVQTFINTLPSGSATYALIGAGVPSAPIEYNPITETYHYIHEVRGSKSVEGFAPIIPVEQKAIAGDDAFDYLDALSEDLPILDDAETDIVNVWMYEAGGPTAYPAEQQTVVIAFNSIIREGGKTLKINYTLHFKGDPVLGTFNASTKAFTAS